MNKNFIEAQKFDTIDFSENPLSKAEYEHCQFINCNFLNADLSAINFSECEFLRCNLSVVKTTKTAFRDIRFKDCKVLGARFDQCNEFLFSAYFENCILNLSSFYKLNLKKTQFINTSLHEVDFSEADLTSALFNNCDLVGAIFDHTVLEKTDFRTAYNYLIDPEINRMKKAKFSVSGISGLLHKYNLEIE